VGSYAGKVDRRGYRLRVHDLGATTGVSVGHTVLPRYDDKAAFEAAGVGWYRDPSQAGLTLVKLAPLTADTAATVSLTR
jgi:hypothetical protein